MLDFVNDFHECGNRLQYSEESGSILILNISALVLANYESVFGCLWGVKRVRWRCLCQLYEVDIGDERVQKSVWYWLNERSFT